MDIASLTFLGLIGLGTVNVITFFRPDLDPRVKFGLSFLVIFLATFVPVEMGNIILDKAKVALETALVFSGVYKLSQKIGGMNQKEV